MNTKRKIIAISLIFLLSIFITSMRVNFLINAKQMVYSYKQSELNQFIEHEPILITNDLDFQSFPGDGTVNNPYLIENLNITSTTESYGINISRTSEYFVIKNCLIDVVGTGIWIFFVLEGTGSIINNTIVNNSNNGVDIRFSQGISILNNNLSNNSRHGIASIFSDKTEVKNNFCSNNGYSGISFHFAKGTIIENNICELNQEGIDLRDSLNTLIVNNNLITNVKAISSDSNTDTVIENNTFWNNIEIGFSGNNIERVNIRSNMILNNKIGIIIENSIRNEIYNNTIDSCSNKGIFLVYSNDNIIQYNRILNGGGYAIFLNYSSNNIIHHNNMIRNNIGGISQAFSRNGINNTWYDTQTNEGNFWDNWLGTGTYEIEGFSGEFDYFPLVEEVNIPRQEDQTNEFIRFVFLAIALAVILIIIVFTYIRQYTKESRKTKSIMEKKISKKIGEKLKFAYSKDVGIALFRFGKQGGELIVGDFGNIDIDIEMFVGYAYVTIGQGQRYETGVYGPIPAPSLPNNNTIVFSFWGKDDQKGDPRMEGKQYYLITVIFDENRNEMLVPINTMKENFDKYMKKFEFPNRMKQEELDYFREIVFVKES